MLLGGLVDILVCTCKTTDTRRQEDPAGSRRIQESPDVGGSSAGGPSKDP